MVMDAFEELRDLVKSPSNRGWLMARLDMGLSPEQAAARFGGDANLRERAAFREMLTRGLRRHGPESPARGGCDGMRGTE